MLRTLTCFVQCTSAVLAELGMEVLSAIELMRKYLEEAIPIPKDSVTPTGLVIQEIIKVS